MKTIGLIGGMSWESTVTYYQIVNETMKKELGGLHSAKVLLYSVDFAEIEEYQAKGEWDKSAEGAIAQIKSKNYIKALEEYQGSMLLVGVNYDKESKEHQCVIEEFSTP